MIVGAIIGAVAALACILATRRSDELRRLLIAATAAAALVAATLAPDRPRRPTPPGIAVQPPDAGADGGHAELLAPLDEHEQHAQWQAEQPVPINPGGS